MGNFLKILVLFVLFTTWIIERGNAQTSRPAQAPRPEAVNAEDAIKARKNAGTIGLVAGSLGGAYPILAEEIAKVVSDGDKLRVLPMLTQGSLGNVEDLLYLHNVDVALTKSESLTSFSRARKLNLKERIRYIARLYDSELHILARSDIRSIEDLEGKKVSIGPEGNASVTTVPIVMQALKIKVDMINVDYPIGLEMMKKGEIAAVMRVIGKPGDTFTKAPADAGFHFLSIPTEQFAKTFADSYVIGILTNKDYPQLIPEGETITTVAVPELLAVYNWPKGTDRYLRVERFVTSFFTNFHKLRDGPFHKKWKDVNLAAIVPGWTRSEIAERMLKKMNVKTSSTPPGGQPASAPAAKISKDNEALFREFVKSRASSAQ